MLVGEFVEQVRPDRFNTIGKPVVIDIAARDLQRVCGEVDGVNDRVRECEGSQYRKAAGTGAQIQRTFYRLRIPDPGRQIFAQ